MVYGLRSTIESFVVPCEQTKFVQGIQCQRTESELEEVFESDEKFRFHLLNAVHVCERVK